MKKSKKYHYISGKQVTDSKTGTRFYDFAGVKLTLGHDYPCKDQESGVSNGLEKKSWT